MPEQTILHGDSREVGGLIEGPIHAVVTDPPFGVKYLSNRALTPIGQKFTRVIEADDDLAAALGTFRGAMDVLLPHLADEAELYVFTAWQVAHEWIAEVNDLPGFEVKMQLIWDKGYPGMGDLEACWGCGYEPILYAKKGRRPVPYRRSGIITANNVHPRTRVHPTEKPVPLLEKLIEMSTDPGDLVVDPFSGSGSTIVAAQRLGRSAFGIERDDEYVAVSRARLQQAVLF